jgi:phosphoribosylformylglycinamidine cyclo-ligase
VLLEPTKIYARTVQKLRGALGDQLHALCHITGGGLPGNLPRVLPDGVDAIINGGRPWAPVFKLIAEGGPVELAEMRRTFNLGIGLVVVVKAGAAAAALDALTAAGEDAWLLGHLAGAAGPAVVRYVHDPEGHRA